MKIIAVITDPAQVLKILRHLTPAVSLSAGTYSAVQSLAITCATAGATLYYTTDGTDPATSGTRQEYTSAITLNEGTVHIRVSAEKAGMVASSLDAGFYTVQFDTVSTPQFSPVGGGYVGAQTVTISCGTTGAETRYTTNGTDPTTTSGTVYTVPISVSTATTVKAISHKSGMTTSTVASAAYSFPLPGAPTIATTAGTGKVTITWPAVSGAASYNVYYRLGTTVSTATYDRKITGAVSGIVISPLTSTKTYAFIVTAVNVNGEGAASATRKVRVK